MTNAVKVMLVAFVALASTIAVLVYMGTQARNRQAETPIAHSAGNPAEDAPRDKEAVAQERIERGVGITLLILWAAGAIVYFIPAGIAIARHHQNAVAISLLNVFLGWTFLGWVASLVWAATSVEQQSTA